MIVMQRPLMAKYSGPDEYIPEGIPRDKFLPVVGVKTRTEERMVKDKPKKIEDIFYLIINDKGKLTEVSSFNCTTEINRKLEIQGDLFLNVIGALSTNIGTMTEEIQTIAKNIPPFTG